MSRGAESSGGGSSSGNQQPETELDPFFNCRRIDRDTVGLTVLVPGGFIIKEEFTKHYIWLRLVLYGFCSG